MNSAASSSDRHNLSLLRVFGQLLLSYQQKDFTRICCVAYNVAVKFPCYKDANHGFVLMEGKKTSSKIVALNFFFKVITNNQYIHLLLK